MTLGYLGVWPFLSLHGPRAAVPFYASVLFTPTRVLWTGLSQMTTTFLSSPSWAGQLLGNCLQLSCRNHNPSSGICCHQCQLMMLAPGHVLIPVNSPITLLYVYLPTLFLQSYSTKIQLHFNGSIFFFPLSCLLCLLWARNSFAQSCKKQHHSLALSRVRQHGMNFFKESPQGMRACVWVMHNFISPDTGPEKAGTNHTCKVTKAHEMAAHKVTVQTQVLHSSCLLSDIGKYIWFPW